MPSLPNSGHSANYLSIYIQELQLRIPRRFKAIKLSDNFVGLPDWSNIIVVFFKSSLRQNAGRRFQSAFCGRDARLPRAVLPVIIPTPLIRQRCEADRGVLHNRG